MASNPLILTLFCRVYEKFGDLSENRLDLYKKSVELLFTRSSFSNNFRNGKLSQHRQEQLFGYLALKTFQRRQYFFDKAFVTQCIIDYIKELTNFDKVDDLKLSANSILEDIKIHSGLIVEQAEEVYSFSYLIFHEYFTAQEVVGCQYWELLSVHSNDRRWREVTFLTVEALRSADTLLIHLKDYADELLDEDPKLQEFLAWVDIHSQASIPGNLGGQPYYIARSLSLVTALKINLADAIDLHLDRALELNIFRAGDLDSNL